MVDFATDPGTDSLLRGLDAGMRARQQRQAVETDAALRRGIGAMLDGQQQPQAAPAPVMAPQPVPAAQPRAAAPTAAPARPSTVNPPIGTPPAPDAAPPPQPPPAAAPQARPAAMPAPQGGGRYDPLLRELTGASGGGAAALQVLGQQSREDAIAERRRHQLGRLSMQALARGDVATGQYWADQAGIPLPPITGGRARGRAGAGGAAAGGYNPRIVGMAGKLADKFYGGDLAKAQAFTAEYISSGGDVRRAFEKAGQPQGGIYTTQRVWDEEEKMFRLYGISRDGQGRPIFDGDGNPVTADATPTRPRAAPAPRVVQSPQGPLLVDPTTGQSKPIMSPDGTTPLPPAQGSHSARMIDRQVRYDQLMATGMFSPQEANAIAAGVSGLSPNQRATLLQRIQRDVAADVRIRPADREAEVTRRFQSTERMVGGPAHARPAAALPPAPVDTPRPQAPAPPVLAPAAVPQPAPPAAAPGGDASIPRPRAPRIPQAAIDRLRANPHEAPLFDRQFGPGAAQRALAQ